MGESCLLIMFEKLGSAHSSAEISCKMINAAFLPSSILLVPSCSFVLSVVSDVQVATCIAHLRVSRIFQINNSWRYFLGIFHSKALNEMAMIFQGIVMVFPFLSVVASPLVFGSLLLRPHIPV